MSRGYAAALISTAAAFLYWARSGFRLSPLEFVVVMGVMWASLVYVCLLGDGRMLRRELFAENEENEGGSAAGIQSLLGLPRRMQDMLTPSLEKVSKTFSGDTGDGGEQESGGEGGGSTKALNASAMGMKSDASDVEVKEMARTYKSIDYLLCRVKHRDKNLYDAVVKK